MRPATSIWVVFVASVFAHEPQHKAHAIASHEDSRDGRDFRAPPNVVANTPSSTSLTSAVHVEKSRAMPALRSATRLAATKLGASATAATAPQRAAATTIDMRIPKTLGATLLLLLLASVCVTDSRMSSSAFPVMGFMVVSSMMLVMNKLAITYFSFPGTLLTMQLLSCAAGVRIVGLFGYIEVEPLSIASMLAFGVTPLAFLATLWANIEVLKYANVETFIMVRNATPLATSVLDWFFLGRELPDKRSMMALFAAFLGGAGYMYADSSFEIRAYSWAGIWLLIFLFDQVYIKHVISTVPMSSWTRVYYNNVLAGLPALVWALAEERSAIAALINAISGFGNTSVGNNKDDVWKGDPRAGALLVVLSCAMGTAMSYFAFRARDALSATSFTVVGNACKILSVLANVFLWDKHASSLGLLFLFLCMAGSACYKTSPLRAESLDAWRCEGGDHELRKSRGF